MRKEINHESGFKNFLLVTYDDNPITIPITVLCLKYFFDRKPVRIPTMIEYIMFKTLTVCEC